MQIDNGHDDVRILVVTVAWLPKVEFDRGGKSQKGFRGRSVAVVMELLPNSHETVSRSQTNTHIALQARYRPVYLLMHRIAQLLPHRRSLAVASHCTIG